jgi:hypothetical protein
MPASAAQDQVCHEITLRFLTDVNEDCSRGQGMHYTILLVLDHDGVHPLVPLDFSQLGMKEQLYLLTGADRTV